MLRFFAWQKTADKIRDIKSSFVEGILFVAFHASDEKLKLLSCQV